MTLQDFCQMKIDLETGLLDEAAYAPSPHCNHRPDETIDMIVVHGISLPPAQFGSKFIEDFFCGTLDHTTHPYFDSIKHLKVTSHLLIDRQGVITQFVPFHLRAWHAGISSFQGKNECNDFSIGIELEGTDDIPYEKIQYQRLAEVINALRTVYPAITRERIVGHSDIAPGRKTDPGEVFDWLSLDCLLTAESA
jgi:N-acetyl-anhydromuramoyl-L-alanine amidase